MHMGPHTPGISRNWNPWAVITLAVCALLVLPHCDGGFVPDTGPPPNSTAARIQAIQAWYDTALSEEQNAPLVLPEGVGKVAGDSTIAAALAAMVRQFPPDWDQIKTWDNGTGGYIAATVLGSDATSPSDPRVSVVRTLVVDADVDGRILSGHLVEFVAPDLDVSQFRDYVVQWQAGDFGNKRMLVAEYTIGYASTQAFAYEPGKDPIPIAMRLKEQSGPGKTEATWYCWVTDQYYIEVCEPYMGDRPPEDEVCVSRTTIEMTCVRQDDDGDDHGDDHGGGGGGVRLCTLIRPGDECPGDDGGDFGGGVEVCPCGNPIICDIIGEYSPAMGLSNKPSCSDFRTAGGTADFSWSEFNGHWRGGNEPIHSPYGMMDQGVMAGIQQIRDLYGSAIVLSSGYRCPYGNRAEGGVIDSQHMWGTAVDISTNQDSVYYATLAAYAVSIGLYPLPWESYPNDRHLHIQM